MKYYFVMSLFVIFTSILNEKIDAAIHRTSSIGKTKAINRTRKPQSKPQSKKPDTSKATKKNEKKNEHSESKNNVTNKKENHENKSESNNKKEETNDKKDSNSQSNANNNNNNNNIHHKEDSAKTQTNLIQNPSTQNNNLPVANIPPQVENKDNSGIVSGLISSIGGSIAGNLISDKLFKSDKHEKHEKAHDSEKEFHKSKHERHTSSSNNNMFYDYYLFSIQNKQIFCMPNNKSKNNNCKNNSVKWTIHGLWPNSFSGNHPFYCSNKDNNPDLFSKELQDNLNRYWPSLASNSNKDFWNHEWKKHGTCANFTELKNNRKYSAMYDSVVYFEKSLDIFNKLKIEELFNHKYYFNSYDDFAKGIKNRINSNNFDSVCYYDKEAKKQYIKELRFKFDKNWGLSTNDTLKQDSNCFKSKPIYLYPERILNENSSQFILNNSFYFCFFLVTILLLM